MTIGDEQLDRFAEHVATALSQQRMPRSPWDRRVNVIVATMAILSLVFSVGVNWSRLESNERAIQDVVSKQDRITSDVRDLWSSLSNERTSNQVVVTKLDAIQQQVSDIKGRLDRGR